MLIYQVVDGSREHEHLEIDIGYGWKNGKFNGSMTDISFLLAKPSGKRNKNGYPEQRYKEFHDASLSDLFDYIEMIQVIRENLEYESINVKG